MSHTYHYVSVFNSTGKTAEPYPEELGDVPLAYSKTQTPASSGMGGAQFDPTALMTSLQQQIAKAASNRDDAVVAVIKEVKKILQNPKKDFTCYHLTADSNGCHAYTFENHGFGDYNIFAKGNDNER